MYDGHKITVTSAYFDYANDRHETNGNWTRRNLVQQRIETSLNATRNEQE